jgi:hypothetical protein
MTFVILNLDVVGVDTPPPLPPLAFEVDGLSFVGVADSEVVVVA